jgi:hypothetical protein
MKISTPQVVTTPKRPRGEAGMKYYTTRYIASVVTTLKAAVSVLCTKTKRCVCVLCLDFATPRLNRCKSRLCLFKKKNEKRWLCLRKIVRKSSSKSFSWKFFQAFEGVSINCAPSR